MAQRYFIGVTTYNRIEFLKLTLESWNKTRRKDISWTLAVADDGSTDGTVAYLETLAFDGVDIILFKNNRVGVHHQTNQLLKAAIGTDFTFGFKIDDDIEFLQKDWDNLYASRAREKGLHHLILFDRAWHNVYRTGVVAHNAKEDGLHAQVPVLESMGAFWTFTPEVVEKVGYFDEKVFGPCGWGHVDYSWRACRAGFNNADKCFDLEGSHKYIRLTQENYRQAMPRGERVAQGNTPQQERIKINKLKDKTRLFVPYPEEIKPRVGVVSEHRMEHFKNVVRRVKRIELVNVGEDYSNIDILVTDSEAAIICASRSDVAVVAMAIEDIPNIIDHEKDGLLFLNDTWAVHWLNALVDEKLRLKMANARKHTQRKDDGRVTVIIPCYNQAEHLERSVGSVVNQTISASIVVIDDGSPDDVKSAFDVLKAKWPDADMRLVQQPNKGLSGARNTGFREAKTGWVIPLDADDELKPNYVEKTLEKQEETKADVVYCDILSDQYGYSTMNFMPQYLNSRNSIVCTCLIRKDLWEKAGGYDEAMRLGFEDWEFWIRCVQKKGKFAKADGALFHYHDAKESMLNESSRRQGEIVSYIRSKHWKMFGIPRVTVIIPCYNQAKYLERCIQSVKEQTEKDIEIIVIDDGSPDDVKGEVKRLNRLHHWGIDLISQLNQGLPGARNAGFLKAKAEWIIPLDADDRLGSTDYIEKCLKASLANGAAGVVMTDGESLGTGKITASVVDVLRMRKENTMHACQMMRRTTWEKVGGYNVDFRKGYEDWEFWVHCLEKGIVFSKVTGTALLIDDTYAGRMTEEVQKAETYWELLDMIKNLHPEFFGGKPKPQRKICSLTVVLSSYNQKDTLALVLESYKHQTQMPMEVIVNDDGSTDGTLEYLDSLTDLPFELRYVTREHSWYRLASGNNKAAKYARGNRILFTNGDQLHCPKSFEAHCELTYDRVGGGVFKGIQVAHSSKVSIDMVAEWDKLKKIQEQFPSGKNNVPHIQTTDPNTNPIGVWGGNFSVPASTFQQIGGYDEEYDVGWGGEENDLVRRCVKAGCRVQWVKESEIFHLDHPIKAYANAMLGSRKYLKDMT